MDKKIIDDFCEQAGKVLQELLGYAERAPEERDEANDGQVRRLRGVNGAITSGLDAIRIQPGYTSAPPSLVSTPPAQRRG